MKGKRNGFAGKLITNLRNNYLPYEKITESVEALLSRTGIPQQFVHWAGDTAATVIYQVPNIADGSVQFLDVLAELFSQLGKTPATKLVPLPEPIMSKRFARKRVAKQLLKVPEIETQVRKELLKVKSRTPERFI
jgi:hypothetical protein